MPKIDTTQNLYRNIPMFRGMNTEEIAQLMQSPFVSIKHYDQNEMVFMSGDEPRYLYILLSGTIFIGRDSIDGKRVIVTGIDQVGESVGGAYLFLKNQSYDLYVQAKDTSSLLRISKSAFTDGEWSKHSYYQKLTLNILQELSEKAYFLNRKVQLLSSGNLRKKIADMLLMNQQNSSLIFAMNREQMADYLGVARPSLSRELMNMQRDGLIEITKEGITILSLESLQHITD